MAIDSETLRRSSSTINKSKDMNDNEHRFRESGYGVNNEDYPGKLDGE